MTKRVWTTLGYWVLMGMVAAWAQQSHKAGLWMIATTTRIQQQGETPGNFVRVVTTADRLRLRRCARVPDPEDHNYGVILPPSLKNCELSNVLQTGDSFKADMTCKGGFNGFGSVESTWKDPDHVVGKIRFVSKTRETPTRAR